jgi:3-(3-hydroxy-phenyl)propionate hydroxylase
MKIDVLVVGAGPVGLAAALFLSRHGLRVRVIDRSDGPAPESRAIGIQARTMEILEMAGAVDEFLALGHRLHGVTLHGEHGRRIGRVAFEALRTRYPYILSLPQGDTERILAARLEGHGVRVERRTTLRSFADDGSGVTATLRCPDGRDEELSADWLVGADGAHSTVREILKIEFVGKTYDLRFLLADLHLDSTLPEGDAQVFAKREGLLAIFPMGGGRFRLVADNPPGGLSERGKPSLEEWQAVVDRRASVPMRLVDPNWTAYFRVHSRMVEHLRKGRSFLMGDAAHIHSPALAQGMNTGIHDAWNLAWKIALVHRGVAAPELLDSYEAERLPVERRVLAMTDFTQNVIGTSSRARQLVRDLILPVATRIPFVRGKVSASVSELAVGYRGSPIVEDHRTARGPHAGDRAPDAATVDGAGAEVNLTSLFGLKHVLLAVVGDECPAGESDVAAEVERHFSDEVTTYVVSGSARRRSTTTRGLQASDEFAMRYSRGNALYLIRPDGYVAFRCRAAGGRRLLSYLSKLFPRVRTQPPPP